MVSIPAESLGWQHQQLLTMALQKLNRRLSEYCFSNLYLFRDVHRYRVVEDDLLFISGDTYDGCSSLTPLFDLSQADMERVYTFAREYDCIYPVDQTDLEYFPPTHFHISCNRDDADYLYTATSLLSYPGRKLAAKRNLVKQFVQSRKIDVVPLTSATSIDAIYVLNNWLRDVALPKEETDYQPCLEAIQYFDQLQLFGFVCYGDNLPLGFLIARELITGTCVVHFAKGDRGSKGVFQYLFQHLAKGYADRFAWYNFEQDLGKPGFRQTKLSYQPESLLNKYRIRCKTT